MDSTSPKYQLNAVDMKKAGTGLLIALGGATVTYLTDLIPNVDWGEYAPIAVAFWAVVINLLRKYFKDYRKAIPQAQSPAYKAFAQNQPRLEALNDKIQEQEALIQKLKMEMNSSKESNQTVKQEAIQV